MSSYEKIKNVVYHTSQNEHHTADVYLPTSGTDHPLVIMVHGGAFQAGTKEMYSGWGPYLAEQGIASMAINYTLTHPTRPSYPQLLNDMEAAIGFVTAHANEWKINPLNLGFMGDSAGGYLGVMAAFAPQRSSSRIKFVISVYGVLDIIEWFHHTNATREDFVVNKLFGTDPYTSQALYENASPLHLVDKAVKNPMFNTKFYLIWGEQDEIVNCQKHSVPFAKRLEANDIAYKKDSFGELGHFWFTQNDETDSTVMDDNLLELRERIVSFVKA